MKTKPENPLQSPGNRQSVSAEHPNRFVQKRGSTPPVK